MKPVDLTVMAIALAAAVSCGTSYPQAPRDETTDVYFGTEVKDPYRPLEDETAPATIEWIKAENRVTDAYFKKLRIRGPIFDRLLQVVNYEKVGVPSRKANGKWYFYRNDGLQNQSVLYESDAPDGKARVLLDPNALSEDGTVAVPDSSSLPRHILVVDDSPVNRAVLKAMLKKIGIADIELANDGKAALDKLKEDSSFDLVLSDMWMPVMDGAELVKNIRSDRRFAHLKVCSITADVEARMTYREQGFDSLLLKPVTIEKLMSVLRTNA